MTQTDEGLLEQFIREFNAFEARESLFERCKDEEGFAWWDVVRYAVQFAICVEKNIYSQQQSETYSARRRAFRLAGRSIVLVHDALRFACWRREGLRQAYVFNRRTRQLLNEVEANGEACLLVNDTGATAAPHVAIRKASLDLFVRLASKAVRIPEVVCAEATLIGAALQSSFAVHGDLRQVILRKYREHRASQFAWSFLLSRLPALERVGFIGDDTLKTLVALANERQVFTREYQHGYIGGSHINYSYPPLASRLATLPCEVLVHRDTGDITYPVPMIRAALMRDCKGTGFEIARDIDVLVGGSPTRVAEAIAIVGALAGKGLSVAVKLHPNQTLLSSGLQHLTEQHVHLFLNELDFSTLARRSHVYVPANPSSTTAFEAVENGAHLIVVNYDGMKMTSMTDGIVSERVDTFESLHNAVLKHLGRDGARTAVY